MTGRESSAHGDQSQRPHMGLAEWRVVGLSTFGGALEFYDFIVYGVFAQYISAQLFPASTPLVSLINTFAVFAVGYLIRPVGGIVLGHFGDRYGRRKVFVLSLLAVSLATIGMGLTPSYATGGIAATIAFVAFRLIQGFCFGGEIAGAVTYIVEAAPRRAGAACGLLFALCGMGVVLAGGVNTLIHTFLTPDAAADYGWRIAFVGGGILGLVGYWVRGSLEESPQFLRIKAHAPRTPLRELVRDCPAQVLVGIGITAPLAVMNGLMFAHMPAYLTRLAGYPAPSVATAISLGITALSTFVVVFGWLSDSVPRRWLHRTGALLLLLGSWPAYQAIAGRDADLATLFMVTGLFGALINGTVGVMLADIFPTEVRFSGIAVTYNLSNGIFQGLTPLLATLLIERTGSLAAPGLWMMTGAGVGIAAGLWLFRYDGRILRPANAKNDGLSPVTAMETAG